MCIVRQAKKTQKTQRTHNPKNNTISPDYYKIMTSCSNHSVNNKQNLSHSWRRRSHRSHKSKLEDHSLCVVCKLCFHSLFGYVQAPKPFEVLRKYWWLHNRISSVLKCDRKWWPSLWRWDWGWAHTLPYHFYKPQSSLTCRKKKTKTQSLITVNMATLPTIGDSSTQLI